jgi:hypothetical protein
VFHFFRGLPLNARSLIDVRWAVGDKKGKAAGMFVHKCWLISPGSWVLRHQRGRQRGQARQVFVDDLNHIKEIVIDLFLQEIHPALGIEAVNAAKPRWV